MDATDELLNTGYPNSLQTELRKALKARGIDYWVAQGITFWNRDDGCECLAYGYKANGVPKLAVKVVGFTDSAQAIAATVGTEPDEQDMLKLHDRMNVALLDMQEELLAYHPRDRENASSKKLIDCVIAAHQIIEDAATVGRGNLTAEQVREAIMSADRWRKPMGDTGMTNTHLIIRDDGWQAIADELNAMVGVGTCELINAADDLGEGTSSCMCSKCGYTALDDWWDEFKHCPNCGKKVEKVSE